MNSSPISQMDLRERERERFEVFEKEEITRINKSHITCGLEKKKV